MRGGGRMQGGSLIKCSSSVNHKDKIGAKVTTYSTDLFGPIQVNTLT